MSRLEVSNAPASKELVVAGSLPSLIPLLAQQVGSPRSIPGEAMRKPLFASLVLASRRRLVFVPRRSLSWIRMRPWSKVLQRCCGLRMMLTRIGRSGW
jgi:hypothetical protein